MIDIENNIESDVIKRYKNGNKDETFTRKEVEEIVEEMIEDHDYMRSMDR